jgi:hypothetical protein
MLNISKKTLEVRNGSTRSKAAVNVASSEDLSAFDVEALATIYESVSGKPARFKKVETARVKTFEALAASIPAPEGKQEPAPAPAPASAPAPALVAPRPVKSSGNRGNRDRYVYLVDPELPTPYRKGTLSYDTYELIREKRGAYTFDELVKKFGARANTVNDSNDRLALLVFSDEPFVEAKAPAPAPKRKRGSKS